MAGKQVIGLKKVQKAIRGNSLWIQDALRAALYQEGLAIDAESVRQVPVEHATLKTSHFVAPPSPNSKRPEVEVGYGTDYAIYVHERMDLAHKSPTKAKFLSDPMEKRRNGYASRLARRTKRNWARKVKLGNIKTATNVRPIVTDRIG